MRKVTNAAEGTPPVFQGDAVDYSLSGGINVFNEDMYTILLPS